MPSWTEELAAAVKVVKQIPQTKRSTPTGMTWRIGARASSARPKTATEPRMKRQRGLPAPAATSAPTSAPAPKHAVTIPNVSGPASSVCFASTGSRTFTLNDSDITTMAMTVSRRTGRVRRTYPSASPTPLMRVGRTRPWSRKSSPGRIASRPARTARKLALLTAKHQPEPTAAITTPASAGPRIRATLKRLELRAIAFGSSSRPTSCIVKFCRAGRSNTTAIPVNDAIA